MLITGYAVYAGNQSIQIPLIHRLNDPSLYPGDPFAATLPGYASMVWRLVALLARFVPLEPLLFACFVLERFLVVYGAGRLASAFRPASRLAPAATMTLFALGPEPLLGGGTLVAPYFEQTGLFIAFFFFMTAAFWEQRPFAWAVWLGLGFDINSLYAAYAVVFYTAILLFDRDYRRRWRSWGRGLVLACIVGLPALVLSAHALGQGGADADLWLQASRARLAHHLDPTTWSRRPFVKFVLLAAATIAVLRRSPRDLLHFSCWTVVAVLWLCEAFLASALGSPALLLVQPARATDLWCCVAAAAALAACAARYEETPTRGRLAALAAMSVAYVVALTPALSRDADRAPGWVAGAGLAVLALAGPPAWRRWQAVRGRGSSLRAGAPHRAAGALRQAIPAAGGALLLVAGVVIAGDGATGPARRPAAAVEEMALWARRNTLRDATFLIPPIDAADRSWSQFRGLSQRSAFVTWHDGAALLWSAGFVRPWTERLGALGWDLGHAPDGDVRHDLLNVYAELQDDDVRRLAGRYPLHYWIVPAGRGPAADVVHANGTYACVAIRGSRKGR